MADLVWLFPLGMTFWFGYCMGEWAEERRCNDEWWEARGEPPMKVWQRWQRTQREETKR